MRLPGRGMTAPVDWLVVGLGNPGTRYAGTRHNIGFEVANVLAQRWQLPKAKTKFNGLLTEGRTGPGGPRVAVLLPQTYMNEAGRSVGPARGAFKVPLERVLVVHDEIDVPFGEVRPRVGGGLAGHNGLKSLKADLGGADFTRVRIGVGRPDSTDPEIVSAHVLGAFAEPKADVADLVDRAAERRRGDHPRRARAVTIATGLAGGTSSPGRVARLIAPRPRTPRASSGVTACFDCRAMEGGLRRSDDAPRPLRAGRRRGRGGQLPVRVRRRCEGRRQRAGPGGHRVGRPDRRARCRGRSRRRTATAGPAVGSGGHVRLATGGDRRSRRRDRRVGDLSRDRRRRMLDLRRASRVRRRVGGRAPRRRRVRRSRSPWPGRSATRAPMSSSPTRSSR